MPLRKLFRTIPNLLLRLKPCLMMSPLSVAHFLEAQTYSFDMVIFDEASQIFPQDAVGAVFRGKQVIIAGDSNQLPPTNFFSAGLVSEDEEAEEEGHVNFDSILEAAAQTLPNRSLLWHYRSRYEELIAFSNREIYGSHLITFPSSTQGLPNTGVEYVYVEDGIYENRCNRLEAKKIVELVEAHILRGDENSLGVIAFSEAQQGVIEEELHQFRLNNPQYEHFFAEHGDEPFFVKNLENVQGDERDTILLSVCYGKNSQGRMYMRFGPLGHQGGERRLNVAITRAKKNVKLVGSIRPEEIDLRKTESEGVRMLRDYIAFAMGAGMVSQSDDETHCADAFVRRVAQFLRSEGWKVRTNLGDSSYTLDIAVAHPEKAGHYLVGIECDGGTYRSARTVRDRDHLRCDVMKNMGWKLYRLWSAAWYKAPEETKRDLLEFLNGAMDSITEDQSPEIVSGSSEVMTETVTSLPAQVPADPDNPYALELYREATLEELPEEQFPELTEPVSRSVLGVIGVEQPIHMEVLCRRTAGCFGAAKVTPNVREQVAAIVNGSLSGKVILEESFVSFADDAKPEPRRSPLGQPDRNIEHISVREIAAAMEIVLRGSYGMEQSVLFLETARIFGFERMGSKIRIRCDLALEWMRAQGKICLTQEKVQLLEVK